MYEYINWKKVISIRPCSYELESFELQIGHFDFWIDNLSVDGEHGYVRGREIVFFQRTDCRNNRIVCVGDKFKTRVSVVGYDFTDISHLKIKQCARYSFS